jgi:hypothetical protein
MLKDCLCRWVTSTDGTSIAKRLNGSGLSVSIYLTGAGLDVATQLPRRGADRVINDYDEQRLKLEGGPIGKWLLHPDRVFFGRPGQPANARTDDSRPNSSPGWLDVFTDMFMASHCCDIDIFCYGPAPLAREVRRAGVDYA